MIADSEAFEKLAGREPPLPRDPEGDPDPKVTLRHAFVEVGATPQMVRDAYGFFGQNVRIDGLRRLSAFQTFEAELSAAIRIASEPSRLSAQG
jgi:hypothetical protein